ncbi:MAG: palmitoyl-CoA hydrolase [Alphaproteobacteria bacterium]|nr:palmitoyl-CoA hydrolase [Alphaproteobacteria bacterium]
MVSAASTPTIEITPSVALIDVPRRIRITGLSPHTGVTLAASLVQADGSTWRSANRLIAHSDGTVDLTRDVPVSGSYRGVSPMGIVWSMHQDDGAPAAPAGERPASAVAPIVVRLVVDAADGGRADSSFEQHLMAPGVTRREIRDDDLVGALFMPASPEPHPAIMVLSGSGGGLIETRAALWASHGFAALALGYFGAPGLPDYIADIPLEVFERGLAWMRRTLRPRNDFVAVAGQSRGGELSLLLGATLGDRVSAVVAYVPSAVTHGSLSARPPGGDRNATAWTYRGKKLPVLGVGNRTMDWRLVDDAPSPRRQTPAFVSGLADTDAVERSMIPVERIRGPVILVSGDDDGYLPSTLFSDMVVERLRRAGHPFPVEHVRCADAGHSILFPYVPTTPNAKPHPVSKVVITGGGTIEGRARADEESWPRVRSFVEAAAAARRSR